MLTTHLAPSADLPSWAPWVALALGIAAMLIGVGVVANYIPARRVLRVDPAIALRAE